MQDKVLPDLKPEKVLPDLIPEKVLHDLKPEKVLPDLKAEKRSAIQSWGGRNVAVDARG